MTLMLAVKATEDQDCRNFGYGECCKLVEGFEFVSGNAECDNVGAYFMCPDCTYLDNPLVTVRECCNGVFRYQGVEVHASSFPGTFCGITNREFGDNGELCSNTPPTPSPAQQPTCNCCPNGNCPNKPRGRPCQQDCQCESCTCLTTTSPRRCA